MVLDLDMVLFMQPDILLTPMCLLYPQTYVNLVKNINS